MLNKALEFALLAFILLCVAGLVLVIANGVLTDWQPVLWSAGSV